MTTATAQDPIAFFAYVIDGLCRAVAARIERRTRLGLPITPLPVPMITLIWGRLRRLGVRFAAQVALARSGVAPRRRATGGTRPRATKHADALDAATLDPDGAADAARAALPRLPRDVAWLIRLVPEAAIGADQLRYLFAIPEMAALIEASPALARTLRPLCRALGVEPPPAMALAPSPRRRVRAKPARSRRENGEPPPRSSREAGPAGSARPSTRRRRFSGARLGAVAAEPAAGEQAARGRRRAP